jgi:hypothetical protein
MLMWGAIGGVIIKNFYVKNRLDLLNPSTKNQDSKLGLTMGVMKVD